jgi:predicted DNA binding protein
MTNFISSMTGMQRKSIEKAYDLGYFSTPRKVNAGDVAHNLGTGRSTCDEHLRGA